MTDWRVYSTPIDAATQRWELRDADNRVLAWEGVIRHWRESDAFRRFWCASLRDVGFEAYAWECPPVKELAASHPFECVFVSCPLLERMPPDPQAFAEHFRAGADVVTFANLGGDAVLVAPGPDGPGSNFSHLASFARTASVRKQDALWKAVGEAMKRRIGMRPVWLSTAGLGVAWLHVRLDDRPKYYRHLPYTRVPSA
jgi:hypothetical protein